MYIILILLGLILSPLIIYLLIALFAGKQIKARKGNDNTTDAFSDMHSRIKK